VPKVFAAGDIRRGQSLVVMIREAAAARAVDEFPDGSSDSAPLSGWQWRHLRPSQAEFNLRVKFQPFFCQTALKGCAKWLQTVDSMLLIGYSSFTLARAHQINSVLR
jgi:hypothetical protein